MRSTTLSSAVTGAVHPRLLFGPEDIAAFREKCRSGIPGRALAELRRRCERYTDPSGPEHVDPRRGRDLLAGWASGAGNRTSDALHCLAFAHMLTGEERWAEHAVALMRAWCNPELQPGGLVEATLEGELPLAYDILHGAMDAADRDRVEHALRERAVVPYQRGYLPKPTQYGWGIGTNTFLHGFEKYVLALGAVAGPADSPALEQCAGLLRRTLHMGVDEGGTIGEGPSYGWGDAEWIALAAEVLRRAGVADLWEEEPNYREMIRHWAYLVLPGRRGQNTIGDAWRLAGQRPLIAHLLHRHRTGDPVLQWVWDRMGGRGDIAALGSAPERFTPYLGLAAIWESDGAPAADPGRAGWPAAKTTGQYGVTVMRSGWGDDDLYFSLLTSGRSPGCHIHQHADAGHFTLFALDEAFSIDSGYGDIRACYHSVFMPDGKEPPASPSGFGSTRRGGRTEAFASSPHAAYARINISEQWNCIWNYRHALMVNAPGAAPYVVLLDNVNYENDYGAIDWLVNSEPGNRIALNEEAGRADIVGRRHRLECLWGWPIGGYSLPHRMELRSDVLDSFPLGHRTNDVDYFHGMPGPARPQGGGRWGAGRRPRLIARLWGYNGMLLSALVPRRCDEPAVSFERFGEALQFGLTLRLGPVTDTIVASPFDRHLDLAGVRGEAALAVIRRSADGRLLWWAAADAYALAIDGAAVLPHRGTPAALCEA